MIQEQIRQEREQRLRGESPSPKPASHSEAALDAQSGHSGCSGKLFWKLPLAGTPWAPHLDTCHLSLLTSSLRPIGFSLYLRSPGPIYLSPKQSWLYFGADHQGGAGKALGYFVSVELCGLYLYLLPPVGVHSPSLAEC